MTESSDASDTPAKPQDYAGLRTELATLVNDFAPLINELWPRLEGHKYRWQLHSYGLVEGYDKLVVPCQHKSTTGPGGPGRRKYQRPGVVLGTHFRPLVGHHRFGGGGVVQLPSGDSGWGAGAAAGWSVGWVAPTSPAVCCITAAGPGAPNWRAMKSAAWSAIPLFL
jgi:hypothetical protein